MPNLTTIHDGDGLPVVAKVETFIIEMSKFRILLTMSNSRALIPNLKPDS